MNAISHLAIRTPDWLALRIQPPEQAATSLRALLAAYDGAEEKIFALRGWALRIIKERDLFRFDVDVEHDRPIASMDRWIECMYGEKKGRYYKESLAAAENLNGVSFEDFAAMPRCNIKQLEGCSSNVRVMPEVIEAAKTMPEKQFVKEVLNERFHQAREVKQPVIMASRSVSTVIDQAIEMAIALEGCQSREEALEAIAAYFVMGCHANYEKMIKDGTA